ncbi:hypothetical protein DPMN_193030 [Dreissena polymorpha]|uniref:Uncharacterized protein n=1 Tax=Dreissena polymorpha TaxID=45954 RepID=A0A9D4BE86_DREPO|nr:hypothetical protein DPMN_193030 [Dreissena polymorpha]
MAPDTKVPDGRKDGRMDNAKTISLRLWLGKTKSRLTTDISSGTYTTVEDNVRRERERERARERARSRSVRASDLRARETRRARASSDEREETGERERERERERVRP